MTKKNYIAIATIVKATVGKLEYEDSCELVSQFVDMFKLDNPNFDEDKFISFINE